MTADQDERDLIASAHEHYFLVPTVGKAAIFGWRERVYSLGDLLMHRRRGHFIAVKMGATKGGDHVMVSDRDARDRPSWDFIRTHRLRSGFSVQTPGGGWHDYLRVGPQTVGAGTRIRFRGLPIDLKMTGYVVLFGAGYAFRKGKSIKPPTELPLFPGYLLAERPPIAMAPTDAEMPDTRRVEVARASLARRYSIAGQGGDLALFKAACFLIQYLRLDYHTSLQLLVEWNDNGVNVRPPWETRRLRYKLEEAIKLMHSAGASAC